MRMAWAFFRRDASIALSYRTAFVVQLLGNLLVLAVFYYIGRAIGSQPLPAFAAYGGSFLGFLLIGIALTDCVGVSLTTFANQIREGQLTGTLEVTLMSPVSLPVILVYSSLWAYFFSAVRLLLYLGIGGVFYGVNMGQADVAAAMTVFLLTIFSFMGIGIMWASVVLLLKRGEAILSAVGYLVILVSGVVFPITMLPSWLQHTASVIPLTHALEGMRFALLRGTGISELAPILWRLSCFAGVFLLIGFVSFSAAVRVAKHTGSLAQY